MWDHNYSGNNSPRIQAAASWALPAWALYPLMRHSRCHHHSNSEPKQQKLLRLKVPLITIPFLLS